MRFFGGCTAGCSLASDTDIPPICEFVLARMMPHPGKCCKAGERDTQLPFPTTLPHIQLPCLYLPLWSFCYATSKNGVHYLFVFRSIIRPRQKMYVNIRKRHLFVFPPNHFIDDARVTLNDPCDLHGHVFSSVTRYRCAKAFCPLHRDGHFYRLKEGLHVDSGQYKASRVQRFRALGGGPDADSREGLTHRQKKAAFLRQGKNVLPATTA